MHCDELRSTNYLLLQCHQIAAFHVADWHGLTGGMGYFQGPRLFSLDLIWVQTPFPNPKLGTWKSRTLEMVSRKHDNSTGAKGP